MHVTQRTLDTLVVEEGAGTAIFFTSICLGAGAIAVIIGWTNEKWLFVIVGTIFALFGLKIVLFNRTRTHRFERWCGGPSYYIYYVTAEGERINWSDYYHGSKKYTLECFQAAREFLAIVNASAAVDNEPTSG